MAAVDLCVIGGGPGGYVAAIRAAQLGMSVACVDDRGSLGGVCLNVGCIPSKALLDSSELYWLARHRFADHGVQLAGVELDLPAMMSRKTKVVRGLTQGIKGLFKKNGVEWVEGRGSIEAPGRVRVEEDGTSRVVEAARVLVATGSAPVELAALPFDGRRVISSTEALALERVPRRLLVIGAGAIGLELGSVWARLGSDVTVVEFLDRIAPAMDRALARQLQKTLEKQGIAFRLGTRATGVAMRDDEVVVALEQGGATTQVAADVVLVAVGRRPLTDGLGLAELGVEIDARGFVVVNAHWETTVPGIFAIGDVVPGPMLAHKAEEEGIACAERMTGRAGHVNYDVIPNVIYTWPELASAGLTEAEAKERGHEVRTGSFPFMANGRARCLGDVDGGVTVVADADTDRVLGVHVLGPRASDLIAEAVVVMEFGGSAEDLARTVHAHPTLPEAMKEAALAVAGRAIHA
jgi:dihydrolipoamide dehydrogenase